MSLLSEEKFLLSDKEIRRAIIIQKLIDGILTTAERAEILSLSERHIKRLKVRNSAGILSPRKHRPPESHQRRPRKEREGMLIQIDASLHHWFGNEDIHS